MTGAQIRAGRTDIHLFALEGLGIDLHAAQVEVALALDKAGATYYLLTWANRAGKTTGLIVIHQHRLFYKIGIPPAVDAADRKRRWLPADYRTLHIAPILGLAGRAHQAANDILKGVSEAQIDRSTGKHRPAPLARYFAVTKERIETGADKMFLRCLNGAICEFSTTEGGGGRLEGATFWFITWDEWPQQEAADKAEAIRAVLTRLTGRASDHNAPILLTGTITPETEHIAKEWLVYCEDPENPDWWGNHASRDINPSFSTAAGKASIEKAIRLLDPEDYARTVMGIPGGVKGRVFPSWLVDPAFVASEPAFRPKEDGYFYLHLWDLALTTADNVGIVLRIPDDWAFSVERPILGARLKVVPGSRTLTSSEIIHTIEETYLPYSGKIVVDATDAHGMNIHRELRNAGYPVEAFDFHGRVSNGVIRKAAAIHRARLLLGEGLEPVKDKTGEIVKDADGVVRLDTSKPYGVFRLPLAWHKVRDQLAVLREEDRGQQKDAAMAFLMGADEAWRKRRAKTTEVRSTPFTVFGRS